MEKPNLKKKERRKRSTALEVLGGVSLPTLRTLKEIAAQADLPLARVFRDVVAIGVSVVSDPLESPYGSLIAFRAGLAQKQAELLGNAHLRSDSAVETRREPGHGEPDSGVLLTPDSEGLTLPGEETLEERSSDALERSGFGSEDETDSSDAHLTIT